MQRTSLSNSEIRLLSSFYGALETTRASTKAKNGRTGLLGLFFVLLFRKWVRVRRAKKNGQIRTKRDPSQLSGPFPLPWKSLLDGLQGRKAQSDRLLWLEVGQWTPCGRKTRGPKTLPRREPPSRPRRTVQPKGIRTHGEAKSSLAVKALERGPTEANKPKKDSLSLLSVGHGAGSSAVGAKKEEGREKREESGVEKGGARSRYTDGPTGRRGRYSQAGQRAKGERRVRVRVRRGRRRLAGWLAGWPAATAWPRWPARARSLLTAKKRGRRAGRGPCPSVRPSPTDPN